MAKVTANTVKTIMKKRALGYTQKEIADVLDLTQAGVKYHLGLLRKRAESEGDDIVFNDYFNIVVLSPSSVKFSYGFDSAEAHYTLHQKEDK